MNNLAVIVICLAIGLVLQRLRRWPEGAAATLNLYVIYVALPALVLAEIPRLTLDHHALLPVVFAWLIMALSAAVTWITARLLKWSRGVTGVLMLTIPLGNTGFLGLSLIEALLGTEAIPYAILYDQFGTFLALNTYGILLAAYYSGGNVTADRLFKTIVSFPPFIALLIAFATLWLDYPDWLFSAFERISSTLVPVVMVAVGLQFRLRLDREYLAPISLGLFYMLGLTPLLAMLILWLFGITGPAANVIVLQAAMPAMISAGVLAMSHNLLPRLAASLVGYSLLLSLFTVWLWRNLLV
ncbi:AEC family transporter [Cellvibrio sp. ARAG 10.3]|uniref:AEC family transporter n=1 Tax=Cellvibrio sp. ARAG 10.3 TaxID=3451358 RepID=UPI003F44D173